jgi:hypothetical protein
MTKRPPQNKISEIASAHGLGPEVAGVSSSAPTDGPSDGGGSGLVDRGRSRFQCGCAWNDDHYVMLNPEVPYGPTVVARPPNPGCVACRGTGWIVDRGRRDLVREAVAPDEGWEDAIVERLSAPSKIVVDHLTVAPGAAESFARATRRLGLGVTFQWALCGDIGLALRPPAKPHRRELRRSRARGQRWGRAWVVEGLADAGQTERQIAALTGIKKSTVHDDIVARSGQEPPIGMDTYSAPTVVERLTAVEARVRDHEERITTNEALIRDYAERQLEAERQLGLPPGGIKAAEQGLDAFLASIEEPME